MVELIDDDDFGGLYADLDYQVNAWIATMNSFQQCCGAPEEDHGGSGLRKEESLASGVKKESFSDNEQGSGEDRIMGFNRTGNLVLEAESEESSESEDDLRIVLNEDGRSNSTAAAWRAYAGNGAEEDVDKDDNLVAVAGSNCLNDDCSRRELAVADGIVLGARKEKANCGCVHVGSQLPGLVDRAQSSFGRGDWDHFIMQCHGDASYGKLGVSLSGQSGSSFSLPRNRTIFDISIEAFEQKPWKQRGVDITDYFNFGLDEESWKVYWQSMEHVRYEAALLTQRPCPNSLRHQAVTEEDSNKAAHLSYGEYLQFEKVEKGSKGLEMMKGRAIQVESGCRERLPSMDVRRPRQRDKDVVIQIPMEKSSDDVSIPMAESNDCCQKSMPGSPANMLHAVKSGERSPTVNSHSEEVETCDGRTLEEFKSKLDRNNSGDAHPRPKPLVQDAVSFPVDRAKTNVDYSDLDTDFEASVDFDHSMKDHNSIKRASSSSAHEPAKSDYYLSDDFRSGDSESEEADVKHDDKPLSADNRDFSRNNLESEIMLRIPSEDEEDSTEFCLQIAVDSKRISCQRKEKKHNKRVDIVKDLTSREESEKSLYYKIREGNHTKEKSSKSFYGRGKSNCYHKRKLAESNLLVDKRVAAGYNETNHDNFYPYRRSHDNSKLRNDARKHYQERISSSDFLYQEKDLHSYGRDQINTWFEVKNNMHENQKRPKEHEFEVPQGRNIPYIGETTHHEFVKRAPVGVVSHSEKRKRREMYIGEVTCDEFVWEVPFGAVSHSEKRKKREMYYESLCTDKDMPHASAEPGARIPKHLDLSPDAYFCLPQTSAKRNHHRLCLPVSIAAVACKSREHYEDRKRHLGSIEMQLKKHRCHSPGNDVWRHHTSHRNRIDFECQKHSTPRNSYDGDIFEKMRYGHASNPWSGTDDDQCLRHGVHVGLSSIPHERNSRHEGRYADYVFESDNRFPEADILSYQREKITNGRNANYVAREDKRYVYQSFDKNSHDLRTFGCEEASYMPLNGVKRKATKRSNQAAAESRSQYGYIGYANHIEDAPEVPCLLRRGYPHRIMEETVRRFKLENPGDRVLKKLQDKHHGALDNEDEEIEEGELIEEPEDRDVGLMRKNEGCETQVSFADIKASRVDSVQRKNIQSIHSAPDSQSIGGQDSVRLLETLAKMEKRRERFKEPLAPRQGADNALNVQVDASTTIDEIKPQRPARKRRWVCS